MSEISEELMLDPPPPEPTQSRFATVVTVDKEQGMQLQMDGEEEASEKYYPYLQHAGGAQLGDRVLVEHISGTMIVTGIVAPPFREATAGYADMAGHADTADYALEAENAIYALSAEEAEHAAAADKATTADRATTAEQADRATWSISQRNMNISGQYIFLMYNGNFYIANSTNPSSITSGWRKIVLE